MSAPDLSPNIATNAVSPLNATADGVTVAQVPLPDQIAADKYGKACAANRRPPFGIVIGAIVSPGAQGQSVGPPWGGWC